MRLPGRPAANRPVSPERCFLFTESTVSSRSLRIEYAKNSTFAPSDSKRYSVMYFRPPRFVKRLFPELHWHFREPGTIFLTFDDGPTPEVTEWVLDTLDRYDAKATFFCLGKNVDLHPEIFRKIKARGHAVGNHSYSHIKGWGTPTERYVEDVDLANGLIRTNLYRPPYGRITRSQIRRLAERYRIVMWDILSRDYSRTVSPEACVRNVAKHLHEGSVVVFHDSVKASENLYYALPRVLEAIRRAGLRCRSIEL